MDNVGLVLAAAGLVGLGLGVGVVVGTAILRWVRRKDEN